MAILVEGYNSKNFKKVVFSGKLNFHHFLHMVMLKHYAG